MNCSNRPLSGYRLLAIPAIAVLVLTACSHRPPEQAALAAPPNDIQLFFDSGSSTLSDAARQTLDQATRLYREGDPIGTFVITGYADSSGGEYANLVLSGRRALATKEALVARGIPATRLQLQVVGSSRSSDPKDSRPENSRRVVVTWR
jgi:OOP family OmpA-OmpF porin